MDREQEQMQFLGRFGIFKESFKIIISSAVVYTIASVYTGRELTFKKVMSVVPKVWKRLMVTFACVFLAFLVYNLSLVLIIITYVKVLPNGEFVDYLLIAVFITYGMWFIYMTMMWQLASVVSVLESVYRFKAMTKSMNLIKGNREIATYIFFLLNMSSALIQFSFESFMVEGRFLEVWKRVVFGVLCFILLLTLFLFGLVIQTILYLVCKSYHHENIDKGDLSSHLESYLGDYERLNSKQVQLEEYHV
ncbi:hypothetical protein L1987_79763 [Smallanthus sonchifolius]|uniref:Uncharacterized protein n=1 Tax=Smallanthus sonchifolius TaxID=185202 RepID=A0ACB8YLC9_9ASTR|nr:hypothetical protein L1987_79763 [Smallanthus sonchifolius]